MDDDGELGRLRERVYGADGGDATPEMIARLVELEEGARRMPSTRPGSPVVDAAASAPSPPATPLRTSAAGAAGSSTADFGDLPPARAPGGPPLARGPGDLPPARAPGGPPPARAPGGPPPARAPGGPPPARAPGGPPPAQAPGDPNGAPADPSSAARAPAFAREAGRPRRRFLRRTLTAVGAAALVGIGVGVGVAIGSVNAVPATTADAPDDGLPELAFPQTSEDVVSADILRDSGIDAASTRYIATIDDFRIYLARPDDGDGRCIVVFTSSDNRPWSSGCASGAQPGAAVFGVDQGLSVAIGQPRGDQVTGDPIRVSDSVTAYVAR
ncbi:hypothetical protein ACIPVB_01050 [Microbacterium sp. NPDC090007]|uniref:hypothetical protein n=1 Tax=Microbacterium sp. NPDC090007 TaxID=3364204 RepID=UPI003807014D